MLRYLRSRSVFALVAVALIVAGTGLILARVPFRTAGVLPPATSDTTPAPDRTLWATIPRPPTATLLPDPGVRLGTPHEVAISSAVVPTGGVLLWVPTLDDERVIAQVAMADGRAIVAIDLSNGTVERLVPLTRSDPFIVDLAASANWIVWLDRPQLPDSAPELYVVNRSAQSAPALLRTGALNGLSLVDDLLIWREIHGQTRGMGIYGLDLATGRPVTVTETHGSVFEPKLCGNGWVIYLEWQGADTADLRAHRLATAETWTIGRMYYSSTDPAAGQQHACDGPRVAWISTELQGSTPAYRQHLYDLTTRRDLVLNMPAVSGGWPRLRLSGDFLVGAVGYDLVSNRPFNALQALPLEQRFGSTAPLLGRNRLVWLAQPGGAGNPQRLYYADIIRDDP